MVSAHEELFERDEIAQRLAHLLPVDGNHVVVHPVFHHRLVLTGHSLRDLTLMMWEYQVHASTMNVKFLTQILAAHGSTFTMPSGETVAPGARPAHDMFRLCFLPQGKVGLVAFLAHTVQLTTGILHVVEVTS